MRKNHDMVEHEDKLQPCVQHMEEEYGEQTGCLGCMLYLLDKFFVSVDLQVANTSMAGGNSDNSTEKKWVGTN